MSLFFSLSCSCVPLMTEVSTLIFCFSLIYCHTRITDSCGLAQSSSVAVESWRAGNAGGQVLGSNSVAPGSCRAGVLLGVLGPSWTNVAHGTHTARGHSHLWECGSNCQNVAKFECFGSQHLKLKAVGSLSY